MSVAPVAELVDMRGNPLRRSLENPTTPLSDPEDWVWEAFGAGKSIAGPNVNRETALKYAAVFRAVSLISKDVGKVPTIIYKRTARGKERATDHPAFRLLKSQPNPMMTAVNLKQALMASALMTGAGYGFVEREGGSGRGKVVSISLLDAQNTKPIKVENELLYSTIVNGETVFLESRQVIHIRGLSFDGVRAVSVLAKARESIGLALASEEYGARFFANNGRPNLILEHPNTIGEEPQKRLKADWDKMHRGLSNAHKVAILEEGMTAHELKINAKDAQLVEMTGVTIRSIANWFGVPRHKVGDTTTTTFASLEQENQSYLSDTLDGWFVNMEQEFASKLLSERELAEDTHFVEFLRQALVRANLEARGEFYAKALGGLPFMTQNEVREIETMNRIDDPKADALPEPANLMGGAAVGGNGKSAPPDTNMDDDDDERNASLRKAHLKIAEDVARRMVKRVGTQARKNAKARTSLDSWLGERIDTLNRSVIADAFEPVAMAIHSHSPTVSARDAARLATEWLIERVRDEISRAVPADADDCSHFADVAMIDLEESLPTALAERLINFPWKE